MNGIALKHDTLEIVIDELLPHDPETVWKALTDGDLIARWMMTATGFEPIEGTNFTFQTKAAGAWDGTTRCQVLEVLPCRRLSYSWVGGHDSNVGYGSRLETVVTWVLSAVKGGTQLRLVHSGFVLPRNETAFANMGDAWPKVVRSLGETISKAH